MRLGARKRIALGAGVSIVAVAFLLTIYLGSGTSSPRFGARWEGQRPLGAKEASSVRTLVDPPGSVRWTVMSYDSSQGPCVDVLAEQIGGTDQGSVGGCGTPDDPLLRWEIGGVEIGNQWFNVAFGEVPSDASAVRVTLGDGSTQTDSDVSGAQDLWIVVAPGSPTDAAIDIARIEVLNGETVIAREEPPSLAAYVQRELAASAAKSR